MIEEYTMIISVVLMNLSIIMLLWKVYKIENRLDIAEMKIRKAVLSLLDMLFRDLEEDKNEKEQIK